MSSTLNVFRYTFLGFGLVAGYRYDRKLKRQAADLQEQNAYNQQLKLVEEAKLAYSKENPTEVKTNETPVDGTKFDLEDPNLDYGKVILNAVETLKN
ncbi:hypothetical protein TBLA_0A03180 [Henningerozyma blattae CBS 6284]|uniref:ATP synthase F(0) complex subunit e, mitochondrial n=1 Tax=Henningerozyma blattae (strain ATCC 34711 / CBS 6284 / DSM 70876 / NBRC 10599 / NRRL Y-10934 / UCD 77-7) TaxID=1071380 RepID=I2GVG6_HENB6|nr:hypothetical protein TBLA_0A03180 [Tetrapisispora blattae CBS 6284]CCH58118.1 hypothetical protein TBLA_0A03180 [Tetrapisispora blattae CBS 6284]